MHDWRSAFRTAAVSASLLALTPLTAHAATHYVPAGGNLQAAITAAQPGDTILLQPGATYVGNFTLPVHGGTDYVTIRSAASNTLLPPSGTRLTPAYEPYLPKIKSPNGMAAMRTLPYAAYWRLMFLELQANQGGAGNILSLGDGSSAQDTLDEVPHHLIVDRVWIRGDRLHGQKRGIGLNSADTSILNSYITDIKGIAQDTQAIAGWNGPGPYRIENNYMEAAAEVFLLGGDDPDIPGLTPSDIVFRGNTLTRPVEWRSPIVAKPAGVRASIDHGGALPAGTYAYRVVARRPVNSSTARSTAAPEVEVTVGNGGRVSLTWDTVPDATEYLVYGRTPGAQNVYWKVTQPAFTDDGTSAGTSGAVPTSGGTVWQVKNIFELKNARRVQVDHNTMENNWGQAQSGVAIMFTPRNQYGGCTWCGVQDVTFEHNIVRHTGAGIKVLGYDDNYPSLQASNIVIRHNEFSDVNSSWAGSGYFLILTGRPRDVTVDHNTIVSPAGRGVVTVDGGIVEGFRFTNNVARHNSYGIQGASNGFGNSAIKAYLPGSVITGNVFAGGSASRYPAGNLFPTVAAFEAHFVDYAADNFALLPGTDWERAGTDGLDLGADMAEVRGDVTVEDGVAPLQVTTAALPATTEADYYNMSLSASGGVAPYTWSLIAGSLPAGLSLDPASGVIGGAAMQYGDFTVTVRVIDAVQASASKPLALRVNRYIPPVQFLTSGLAPGMVEMPYAQALQASGGLGTYTWALTAGSLPEGLTLDPDGVIRGVPLVAASNPQPFEVTVYDAQDASRRASAILGIVVEPQPIVPPTVTLTTSATDGAVVTGSSLTLVAHAVDVDGTVLRVDFYVSGVHVGSRSAAPFSLTWHAGAIGSYSLVAVAIDDDSAAGATDPLTLQVVAPPTQQDIVLYAAQLSAIAGDFQLVDDASAAGGLRLWNPNRGLAKQAVRAAPTSYAEFTFFAEAGRPYHLWVRGRAEKDHYNNDSVWFQFTNVASAAIGTTSAMSVILEDTTNAVLSGWGWQDNGYSGMGQHVVFAQTGMQTLRITPREDGLSIDQIVLSPQRYLTTSPGALRNDTTIVTP